jgi:structural maintenance of chromosome 1
MVENLKRIFPKVHGRLIDLCTPINKKFEQAASIIMGKHLDSIVVDSEAVALECIRYLKDQRFGQATFLPLDTLIVKITGQRNLPNGVRPAIEVLRFSSLYLKAFQFVCSEAVVCDDLNLAREVAFSNKLKTVTLDGSIIHKSGLMTGGAPPKERRRWEDQEIVQMRRERESLMNELSKLADQSKALKNVKPQDFTDLEQKNLQLENSISVDSDTLSSLQAELEFIETEITGQHQEISDVEKQLAKHPIDQAKKAIRTIEEKIFGPLCKKLKIPNITEFEDTKSLINAEINERRAQYENVKSKLSAQLEFLHGSIESLNNRASLLNESIESAETDLNSVNSEKENIMGQVSKNQGKIQSVEEKIYALKKSLSTALEQVDVSRKEQKKANEVSKNLEHSINVRECQIEKMLNERGDLLRKCRLESIHVPLLQGDLGGNPEAVLVDFSPLPKNSRKKESGVAYAEKLKNISDELDRLAPNLRAIDKLEGDKSRISAAIESFEKSRQEAKQARDAFQTIRKQRINLFTPALNHVMETIDQVYKQLTRNPAFPQGGTAFVSLAGDDAEEPYNDGIRFTAMPPTKRFLDMEHLSGGERTIAALALLFAIHSYRPAPFFILDEVDAALDSGNVAILGDFLRQQAEASGTQFVVISLKGALYEKAESLVGVYKQDISSRILTLRLTDYPEGEEQVMRNEN